MSGSNKLCGERIRSATGNNKRLSRFEINEIKHAIEIENAKCKRKGKNLSSLKWCAFTADVIVFQLTLISTRLASSA
ncbi:hypothetical protein A3Q29_16680 [Providencia stuartii]|uniref:Uncharacterized protein n=1 Tax=Providencia stuartii TaxID=588 RepID=A0A1S1HR50_PROST|nr:hypothetical protein A3Q29_16680 [Providencia stuartii]